MKKFLQTYLQILMLPIFVAMLHGLNYLITPNSRHVFTTQDHFTILLCGVAMWLFSVWIKNFSEYMPYPGIRWVNHSILKSIALITMPFAGFGLIGLGVPISVFTMMPLPHASEYRIAMCTYALMFLVLYVLAVFYIVFRKFVVETNNIVIKDGAVLYPGEEFVISPLISNELVVLNQVQPIRPSYRRLELVFTDCTYLLEVESAVTLNIQRAREMNIRTLDYKILREIASTFVRGTMLYNAKQTTLGRFLTIPATPIETTADGFPIIWDGTARITPIPS